MAYHPCPLYTASNSQYFMADFKTHVTFSSVLGCGYAFAGMTAGMGTSTSLVAGGLCGLSGMLPDVDSDSGIPRRETMSFAAAIVPMLLVSRFREMGLGYDEMVLSTACLYFAIRFGLSRLIGEFSVHRGMWHSVPAALIFAGLAFIITGSDDINLKYFKALAVFLGTMSHLVLDEVYSVDTRGVVPRFKKSFGTAVKFWGKSPWANFSTYAKLAVVAIAIFGDRSSLLQQLKEHAPRIASDPRTAGQQAWGYLNPESADQTDGTQAPTDPPAPAWQPQPNQQGGFRPSNGQSAPLRQPYEAPPSYPQPHYQPQPQPQRQPRSYAPPTHPYQPPPNYGAGNWNGGRR